MRAWSRLSIATKLPLSLATLLAVAFGGMTSLAYLEVRSSALAGASDRLSYAGHALTDLFGVSLRQRLRSMQTIADRSPLIPYLHDPQPETRTSLVELFTPYVGNTPCGVELWDSSGTPVLTVGVSFPAVEPGLARARAQEAAAAAGPVVGPYEVSDEGLVYNIVVALRESGSTTPQGFLVERRRVANSSQTLDVLTNLIGSGARLVVGNAVGNVWSDLSGPVDAPPALARDLTKLWRLKGGSGETMVARAVAVPDTPWLVAIEFPEAAILQPARHFLHVSIGLSLLLVLGSAATGWVLSRKVTTPLRQVTEAAEAIAQSKSARPIVVLRADEVGRLARSFNVMAGEVTQSRQRLETLVNTLEQRVIARTAAIAAANRELEAFSYSVSHDLRSPLRAIDGFARILVEDHAAGLPADAIHCLDVIRHRAKHMGQLIDDLLAFSRLGRQPLTRGPVDMGALASATVEDARRADPARVLEIIVQPLPPATGERALIRQIFDNLIQNAVKFTRTRPVARIEIGTVQDAADLAYFVRDNGVGFDMQYADKLFGVFQRLHRADEFEGTGVGLAIVQRIVARHGGRVWAESIIDQGTTFYFTLPHEASGTEEALS